jgi:Fic family protein
MTACLGDLERFLHETILPPLVHVALVHYQFEAIHPFLDGNGRVGRLLVTLFLVERGILPTPLLYLSAFFEATRREYYEGLQGVTERSEWERWLGYFLNGVARQSEDALGRAERINRHLSAWRLEIAGISSKTPALLLERLSANPFQTVRMASREMGIAFTTVQRAMEKLESLSIVSEVSGGKRDRVYCAKALMEILEEPARLAP